MSSAENRHDAIEELVVADALDGLDEADRLELERELAAHGAECQECRALIVEYGEVAGRLAFVLDPLPMAAGAEDLLVEAARANGARHGAPAIVEPEGRPSSVPPGRGRPETPVPERTRRWLRTAAVAAAMALIAGFAGYALAPKSSADLRVITFPSQDRQHLAVVYQPGTSRAVVVGANLPAPPPGKVYELWYQPAAGEPMHPGGTFEPKDGRVAAEAEVGESFVVLAVSIEPDGGSPQPTTEPVFVVGA